ncbi:MAG: hypothetical protein OEX22_00460 [Cyclobacteriaceae bacterium]|nr:hypothetical protein [Cyclobacteriaceae bacterium]
MNKIIQGDDVLDYIPQRPPFVMVDAVYEKGENHVVTGLTIEENNVMVENGEFKDGGLIENIAQTAALFAGTKFKDAGKEIPLGYIAGIKDVKIFQNPSTGSDIFTTTTLTNEMMNIQIVKGEVKNSKEEILASCELRIFINK